MNGEKFCKNLGVMTKKYEKFTKKTALFEGKRQKTLAIMLNA